MESDGTQANSCYEFSITLISNLEKDRRKKKNYRLISLINLDAKYSIK
jgi:hypothetical protein